MELARIAALLAPFLGDADFSEAQLSQLSTYLDLLQQWNARMNLTSVRDPEQIVCRHFGESLFTARHLYPAPQQLTTDNLQLDIGSGAGFPGLPIKIWAPRLCATLIESQHRKATFLREVIRALALPATDVFPGRAENFDIKAAEKENLRVVGPGAPAGAAARGTGIPTVAGAWPATPSAGSIANRQSSIGNFTITLRAVERFDRVLPTAARLLDASPAQSRRLALLIGDAQVPRVRQLVPRLSWSDPIPIPQSSNRVLLIGTRPADSGGTQPHSDTVLTG